MFQDQVPFHPVQIKTKTEWLYANMYNTPSYSLEVFHSINGKNMQKPSNPYPFGLP